jgi:hypothetical protein
MDMFVQTQLGNGDFHRYCLHLPKAMMILADTLAAAVCLCYSLRIQCRNTRWVQIQFKHLIMPNFLFADLWLTNFPQEIKGPATVDAGGFFGAAVSDGPEYLVIGAPSTAKGRWPSIHVYTVATHSKYHIKSRNIHRTLDVWASVNQ